MTAITFRGAARRLDDVDLPRIGATIGVGEDELHALLDVEAAGSGFDKHGRPKMLFEPHVFDRELGPGPARDRARADGLAYPRWGERPYPGDSYPRLLAAMLIDETAALRSASWGLGQILGSNHAMCGYASPQAMVAAFVDDEERHLEAIVAFIVSSGLDDDLRRLAVLRRPTTAADCAPIARVYNGSGYERHGYHVRLAKAHNRWRKIPDTPWDGAAGFAKPTENMTDPIPAPPPPMRPLLVKGSKGEWVRELQEALRARDFTLRVDGDFGPATALAVRDWQKRAGLDVDGRVGPATWESLTRPPDRALDGQTAPAGVSVPEAASPAQRAALPRSGGNFTLLDRLPDWMPAAIRNWFG